MTNIKNQKGEDFLLLKWGTIKGYCFENSPKARKLIREYYKLGRSFSTALQTDTIKQKKLVCKIIDAVNGPVTNDWTGATYRKAASAKRYVMNTK